MDGLGRATHRRMGRFSRPLGRGMSMKQARRELLATPAGAIAVSMVLVAVGWTGCSNDSTCVPGDSKGCVGPGACKPPNPHGRRRL